MSFEKELSGNHAMLPKIKIGGTEYHVKPYEGYALEMADHITAANTLAKLAFIPSPEDDEPHEEPKAILDLGMLQWYQEHGVYAAKTKGAARLAKNAVALRNHLIYASCVIDLDGQRPWWNFKEAEQLQFLVKVVATKASIRDEIGLLSGLTKMVEETQAKTKTNTEATAPGN